MALVCGCVWAQPTFEVASIKPSSTSASPDIERRQGGPGSRDPGRIVYHNFPIRDLIKEAYQVFAGQISAPVWLLSVDILQKADTFEIEARFPVNTSREQYRLMLQNLLVERFGLKVHREKQEGPAYQLVVNKGGAKISRLPDLVAGNEEHRSVPAALVESTPFQLGPKGKDGFPTMLPDYSGFFVLPNPSNNHIRYKFMRMTMEEFANWLWWKVKKPVVDETHLKGKYDFYIEHVNGAPSADDVSPNAETLFEALQRQLGLKLASGTGQYEMLVIDHVDRMPSAN